MAFHAPSQIRSPNIVIGGRYQFPWSRTYVFEVKQIHPLGLCSVRRLLRIPDGGLEKHCWPYEPEFLTIGTLMGMETA